MSQLIKWLRFDTVEEVYNWSRWMMDLHGLQDWKVEIKNRKQFPAGDRSCSGICYGATETICIDRSHALGVRMGLVMDTVWHEIAHALVGIQAGSLSKKYALAVDWMCDNNGTLKQAAGKFGIPHEDARHVSKEAGNLAYGPRQGMGTDRRVNRLPHHD